VIARILPDGVAAGRGDVGGTCVGGPLGHRYAVALGLALAGLAGRRLGSPGISVVSFPHTAASCACAPRAIAGRSRRKKIGGGSRCARAP
jgi:hypothetical protein